MPFQDAILAGNTLVRDSIKSENYVAGSAGWQISRNGDAEFNSLVSRGSFIGGNPNGKRIELNGSIVPNGMGFFTGDPNESGPGTIQPVGGSTLVIDVISPSAIGGTTAEMRLSSSPNVANSSVFFSANNFGVSGALKTTTDEVWHNVPLVNGWVSLINTPAVYYLDFAGNVHVIGRISSGTTGQIATLPVNYRPRQTLDFPLKSNNDASSISWVTISSAGVISAVGNVAAAQTWLALQFDFNANQ